MNPLVRIPLLMSLLAVCASIGFGQKFCRPTPPSPYKHTALIVSKIDKKAGKYKTVMEYPALDVMRGARFTLAASFFHHDLKLGVAPTIDLAFAFVSEQANSQHAHDLSILINGQPWVLSAPVEYASKKLEKGLLVETTRMTLTYEKLSEITKARSVRVRLGALEYPLSFDNLEALREVASQIEPYLTWNKWSTIKAERR